MLAYGTHDARTGAEGIDKQAFANPVYLSATRGAYDHDSGNVGDSPIYANTSWASLCDDVEPTSSDRVARNPTYEPASNFRGNLWGPTIATVASYGLEETYGTATATWVGTIPTLRSANSADVIARALW
jgi:hypothetical protein